MIEQFRVQNYKALRDVTLDLMTPEGVPTPIHVLIGPNDSGKTSILEALLALCRSVEVPLAQAFEGDWEGRELVWWGDGAYGGREAADGRVVDLHVIMEATARLEGAPSAFKYRWECDFHDRLPLEVLKASSKSSGRDVFEPQRAVNLYKEEYTPDVSSNGGVDLWGGEIGVKRLPGRTRIDTPDRTRVCLVSSGSYRPSQATDIAYGALSGVQYYRWNPRMLALPAAQDSARQFRMDRSGFGLVTCLFDILAQDRKRIDAIEDGLRPYFKGFEKLNFPAQPAYEAAPKYGGEVLMLKRAEGRGIEFRFEGKEKGIPASQASDGMLLVLAYLTVLHLPTPPRLLLIEEPENGIHPKRLQDVLKILRKLIAGQSQTQVLMTTHSPYALDEFKPEEVTLCQKGEDGAVRVTRLSDSPKVRKQLGVFTLGEIWGGEGEEALAADAAKEGDAHP